MCVCVFVHSLSCVWIFATPWTVAFQTPPSMEFFRQEYWSGLLFLPSGFIYIQRPNFLSSEIIIVISQFSRSVVSDSLWPHRLQHARLPWLSPIPAAYTNSCPSSQWCHQTILCSVVPFSTHLQSFPVSGSLLVSQFFASGGQSIGVSAQHQSFQWIFRTDFL